jgi:hypothetical protein
MLHIRKFSCRTLHRPGRWNFKAPFRKNQPYQGSDASNLKLVARLLGQMMSSRPPHTALQAFKGHAAAGAMALNNVNALARELYSEAVEKFGVKMVHSKSANHLARMQNFLKGHPKYAQLMQHLKNLPKHLLPDGSFMTVNTQTNSAVARHFRKHVSLPLKKWGSSSRYVGSMAKQLNGRLSLFKNIGRGATWYVPATLGVISVATASPELRMRTLFEEGVGVIGGAAGTKLGVATGLGIVAILGLGPFGLFVAVFICASAGGMLGMEIGKNIGSGVYDLDTQLDSGRIFYSPENILGAVK